MSISKSRSSLPILAARKPAANSPSTSAASKRKLQGRTRSLDASVTVSNQFSCLSVESDSIPGSPVDKSKVKSPASPSHGDIFGTGSETDIPHFGFSAKTCLELLPKLTMPQLEHEIKYLNINTKAGKKGGYQSAIKKELTKYVCDDFAKSVDNINETISSLSSLVKRAENAVEKLASLQTPSSAPAAPVDSSVVSVSAVNEDLSENVSNSSETPAAPVIDPSVCTIYDGIFCDLSVSEILSQLTLNVSESYGRKTTYFGSVGYSYGRVSHAPAPYPSCTIFDRILEGMRDLVPDFSLDDYTCLVTHYPDGKAQIPLHDDGDQYIVEGSTIYTVSVGCDRFLTLQNQVGLINETAIEIKHGSVYSMSQGSQGTWKHAMLPQNSTEPRISFGFRRLKPTNSVPKRAPAPPITRPDMYSPLSTIPTGTHERCLLLTDSILSAAPTSIFNRAENVRCIKKSAKRLVDVFDFEPEFGITNTVIISAGVNDLSCHGLSARALADTVCSRLRNSCQKYRGTRFIFNSVLNVHNKHGWLNHEIDTFNELMHRFCLTIPNMAFFDSHSILMNDRISQTLGGVIDLGDVRGVHITWQARKMITEQLVNAVELTSILAGGKRASPRLRNWNWPKRTFFAGHQRN